MTEGDARADSDSDADAAAAGARSDADDDVAAGASGPAGSTAGGTLGGTELSEPGSPQTGRQPCTSPHPACTRVRVRNDYRALTVPPCPRLLAHTQRAGPA